MGRRLPGEAAGRAWAVAAELAVDGEAVRLGTGVEQAGAAREARLIAEQGIATKEDIDKAMITGRNWPSAFFGSRGGIGKEW